MAEENKPEKQKRRRLSAEDKVKILSEILLKGRGLSELADEYKIHPNKILEWRKVLFESATGIFEQKRPDITEKAQQRKIDALEKTLADKDAVIADIAQENLALKKKINWPSLGKKKMSLSERTAIIAEIDAIYARTGIAPSRLVSFLGIPQSTWNNWVSRRKAETRHNHDTPKSNWMTPEETRAIVDFCKQYKDHLHGYRYLAWLMVDRDIAYARPSTVYNILKRNNLFGKWAFPAEARKKGFDQPTRPNEQWHTDYSYVRVCGVFFYFACVLDGFSRKVLVWDLFSTMEGLNVEILVTRAKELHPDAHARIIHDNGKQFASKDFLDLVSKLELRETSTSPFHPQSNGKVERFHKTLKAEEVRRDAYQDYSDAKRKMSDWINYYNSERLHSAIGFLTPDEVFAGKMEERLAERRTKLYNATREREDYWANQPT